MYAFCLKVTLGAVLGEKQVINNLKKQCSFLIDEMFSWLRLPGRIAGIVGNKWTFRGAGWAVLDAGKARLDLDISSGLIIVICFESSVRKAENK